jgi:hypothetical protein
MKRVLLDRLVMIVLFGTDPGDVDPKLGRTNEQTQAMHAVMDADKNTTRLHSAELERINQGN